MKKIIILIILLLAASIHAATYCVNQTGGSDSNNGACATPWATVRKAFVTVSPNDTVVIGPGNYDEYVIASNSLQTADNNVTYIGFDSPTIRLANATCNRVVDVLNSNITFNGIIFDSNGTLDSCEFGIYIRNTAHDLRVLNSVIKNTQGASASALKIETSGLAGSNNAIIYNNSFINNENYVIDLNGGNSNNTNITANYIEVGRTTADYGIVGSTANGGHSYNLTIKDNRFNWTGTVGQEANGILLQRTVYVNSSFNTQIVNNTFGEPNNKWEGTVIRIVRQQESNVSNNQIWENDTTSNVVIYYEGQNNQVTFSNNIFCSSTNLCSATGNLMTMADTSNVTMDGNQLYFDIFGGDGLWAQSSSAAQSNATITNNYLHIGNITDTGHVIGTGSEGSGQLYSNVYVGHNTINITHAAGSGSSHNLFLGTTLNATAYNNTIYRGSYGLLAKLSENITYDSNRVYNVTVAAQYDKGSNYTIFKNNYIEALNQTDITYIDGINANSISKNITLYNNTYIFSPTSNNAIQIGLNLGLYQTGTQSYSNYYYLPYRSYNRTFVNYSAYYNYQNWQTTLNKDINSTFYPNDTVILSLANNSYYNGNNWSSAPIINGITIANATFYLNYSNGTNYLTLQNTSSITNATNYTFQAQINTTDNFTWNVCYKDPNSFTTCGANWFTVKSDVTTPTLTINLPTNNTNQSSTTLTINFSATDETSLSTCWYSINNTANVTVNSCINATTNQTTTTVTQGDNQNITIYANDSTGNIISATRTFDIDTTAPMLTINSPANNTNQSSTALTLNFSATDAHDISTCWYSINNTVNTTILECLNATTNETNITVSTGANQNITIYANDTLGNFNSTTYIFTIAETTTPTPSSGSSGSSGGGASITTTNNTQNNTTQNNTQNSTTNRNIISTIKPPIQKTTNKTFDPNSKTIQNTLQLDSTINKETHQLQSITLGVIIAAVLLGIIIFAKFILR